MNAPTVLEHNVPYSPDALLIPGWVKDLTTFRRWSYSDQFPEHGLFAYLQGDIWVDLSMEELLTHNRVRAAFDRTLITIADETGIGYFAPDRMRWTNEEADLSTEPDGLFHTWQTLQSGRLRFVKGKQGGVIELEGTPDMVLEIVSAASMHKDTVRLRELYWKAGVTEYWLVDARGETPVFEILRHSPTGYVAAEAKEGWLASTVFGRAFRLTRKNDPLGNPLYNLETREPASDR